MGTQITELHAKHCARCSGQGHIAQFQHRAAGVCFRCSGTGRDPVMNEVSRDMTDDEILTALDMAGFPVIFPDENPEGYLGICLSDAQIAKREQTIAAARVFYACVVASYSA